MEGLHANSRSPQSLMPHGLRDCPGLSSRIEVSRSTLRVEKSRLEEPCDIEPNSQFISGQFPSTSTKPFG